MEVLRLGVELELQLPAYTTAHSQRQILNPLSKAKNVTCILMDTSRILNLLSHTGTPVVNFNSHICCPFNVDFLIGLFLIHSLVCFFVCLLVGAYPYCWFSMNSLKARILACVRSQVE